MGYRCSGPSVAGLTHSAGVQWSLPFNAMPGTGPYWTRRRMTQPVMHGAPRPSMSPQRGPRSTTAAPASAARYGSRRLAIPWTHSTSDVDTTRPRCSQPRLSCLNGERTALGRPLSAAPRIPDACAIVFMWRFRWARHSWRTLACTLLPMLAAAGGAQAQSYGYGYDDDRGRDGGGIVRCESIKNRSNECRLEGRARMIRQLSGSPCVEGETWGNRATASGSPRAAVPSSSASTAAAVAGVVAMATAGAMVAMAGARGHSNGHRPNTAMPASAVACAWSARIHAVPASKARPGLGPPWHLGQRRLPGAVPGELSAPRKSE